MKIYFYNFNLVLIFIAGLFNIAEAQITPKKKDTIVECRPVLIYPIHYTREGSHFSIDQIQEKLDLLDQVKDSKFNYFKDNINSNAIITKYIFNYYDDEQIKIENLSIESREKIFELSKLETDLKALYKNIIDGNLIAIGVQEYIKTCNDMNSAIAKGNLLTYVNNHPELVFVNFQYKIKDNEHAMRNIIAWYTNTKPFQVALKTLERSWNKSYADTMISILVDKDPNYFFNYIATTTGTENKAFRRCTSPTAVLLQTIADKATKPFRAILYIDDIASGKMTINEVNQIVENEASYLKGLIQYRLNSPEVSNKKEILKEIKRLSLTAQIRKMNELHDQSDIIRFRSLDNCSFIEMYYYIVSGEEEIYTSSFIGLYKRMMAKMNGMQSDSLLEMVHFDKFRTFLKMCAGYNTIGDFLDKMNSEKRDNLLIDFVSNLEKSQNQNLEEAVNVADSYGSIKNDTIKNFIKAQVKKEFDRCVAEQNNHGIAIYKVLNGVIENEKNTDTSQSVLNLPPALFLPIEKLKNAQGEVDAVMYFYGDEDGINNYKIYSGSKIPFKNFTKEVNKDWVCFHSTTPLKVNLYMNVPHPEPKDEEAIHKLKSYMDSVGIHPGILVHRGHSYHTSISLSQIENSNKLIFLGSCGGYHQLREILTRSNSAQIVSSKQTGVGVINNWILDQIFNAVQNNQNLEWIKIWNDGSNFFAKSSQKEQFDDYIAPYQNLGAIFVQGYYQLMGVLEE